MDRVNSRQDVLALLQTSQNLSIQRELSKWTNFFLFTMSFLLSLLIALTYNLSPALPLLPLAAHDLWQFAVVETSRRRANL